MFIMSTIADGPYWPSALEPLVYPVGCSFYRPFSYLKSYVHPDLLKVFSDPEKLKAFLSNKDLNCGVFGIRLRGGLPKGMEGPPNVLRYGKTFIPLRWVKLTDVHIPDSVQLSLTLGGYIPLKDTKDRKDKEFNLITLDGLIDFTKRETMLMREIPGERMSSFIGMPQPPEGLWQRLADDESLSPKAQENFRGSTVLRLATVAERGSTTLLTPTSLEPDRKDQIYGFKLRTGKLYDFELDYNRISGPGESHDPFLYDYKFGAPPEHFGISRDTLRITGNYRTEVVWVQPKKAQPASVLLEWDGIKRSDKSPIADPKTDKIMPMRVPVISVAYFWSRERKLDAILTATLFAATAFCFYFGYRIATGAAAPAQPGVQPISSTVLPIFLALGAFFAGLFGGFLKDFIRGRS